MTMRRLTGRGYWVLIGMLLVALVGLGTFVALAVVLPEAGANPFAPRTPAPTVSPEPNSSEVALAPMTIPVPANSDCAGCHQAGGIIEIKDVPAMAHPLQGWSDCTACHADDRLVKTAPGHNGIHRELCLACHQEPQAGASALPRPHHVVEGQACITCHGSKAPLPSDMEGRSNCWLCHPGKDSESLFAELAPTPPSSASPGP